MEIYLSEMSRVRYLLRSYLRCRLQKIERHVMHILDNAGAWAVGSGCWDRCRAQPGVARQGGVRAHAAAPLRARLHSCPAPHPAAPADIAARLSEKEAGFARDYFVLFGSHMKAAAANHLPGGGWGWAFAAPTG